MSARVAIILGSQSDWDTMQHASSTLDVFGIEHEVRVISAHRAPAKLHEYCGSARERGLKVIIAAAGLAAALPGACAAITPLPVLGVPMYSKATGGMDALLSMSQMPGGVPVGTLAIGKPGAVNAAVLAASILALGDETVAAALDDFRRRQTEAVVNLPDPREA
ncbi:MAG: 5-(carboxyamino)imidazole ribonucleotide mutase [Gammaproteobacteria bacterium]|nr:MAG: 5-(carboxyamino)imidazole ribonucleotide mutase [Gammaproteobacteria bacterium]